MKRWIAKLFYKSVYLRVDISYPDGQVRTHYVVPNDNIITIDKSCYEIYHDRVYHKGNERICFYSSQSPVPLTFYPSDEEINFIDMTPQKLYAGMESKLAEEFFVKFNKSQGMKPLEMVGILSIILLIGLGIFMYYEFSQIQQLIQSFQDMFTY